MILLNQLLAYARFVVRRFIEDRCLMVAGSLTYTSLLALVPLLTVTIAFTANFAVTRSLTADVKAFALKSLVPDVGGRVVGVYMEQFTQNASRLTVLGLSIILATALMLMFTIDGAFNDIWRAKRRRSWLARLAAYVAVLAVGPLLIGASLTLTSYIIHWSKRFDRVLPFLDDWLVTALPFAMSTLALVIAYRVMPARHVPTRHALIGGVFAGLLFEVVKHLFVAYVLRVPTYSVVYGAFASVPIFLLWLYCCWMVVLIGAEIAATLSYFRHDALVVKRSRSIPIAEAMKIIDVLGSAAEAMPFSQIREHAAMPIDIGEDILHALVAANIVQRDKKGGFRLVLARDAISDDEVFHAISAH